MTVSTVKKSHATIPAAWERKNVVHDSDVRVGAGSIPAFLRIAHTVDAAMVMPGEFAVDAAVAPRWVLPSETDDRPAGLDRGGGSAGSMRVGPVVRDEASMPTQDRVGSDEEDRPAITAEYTRQRGEDRSVVGFEART
jgi:hypothetical protein